MDLMRSVLLVSLALGSILRSVIGFIVMSCMDALFNQQILARRFKILKLICKHIWNFPELKGTVVCMNEHCLFVFARCGIILRTGKCKSALHFEV